MHQIVRKLMHQRNQRKYKIYEQFSILLEVFYSSFFVIFRPKIIEADDIEDEPKLSRHYVYAKHFPLNHDDPMSQHDCNQRYILLFGVGKERDEKKHAVKKMAKG